MLRKKGVVNKFVEFYGAGLSHLSLEDKATIANMAPEYGATCGFFPVDKDTLAYLKATGRDPERIALVEAYAQAQGLFRTDDTLDPLFTDAIELDLATVVPSLAGPKRPQDRVALSTADSAFDVALAKMRDVNGGDKASDMDEEGGGSVPDLYKTAKVEGKDYKLADGHVVIAAITSCTNTSNPSVLIAAGLLARNARAKGLTSKPWVKTSLAPGSQIVTDYLAKAGLNTYLDKLGFQLVGYGCTTCIGNSGPLPDNVTEAITTADLVTAAVLSGNRNFEGRVHPLVRASYLASPMLVVAYALAGSINIDLTKEPVGYDKENEPVYLKDIWPSAQEISAAMRKGIKTASFKKRYGDVFKGDANWRKIKATKSQTYNWPMGSTYVKNPPFFEGMTIEPQPVKEIAKARILALFGDSITTDHISPAGNIKTAAPAGVYLQEHQVRQEDFNSYGARRGNFELMERGTFANIRIRNEMMGGKEGGNTLYYSEGAPSGEQMPIFDAAERYKQHNIDTVIVAGKEYGTGSSRDWAAKGPKL